MITPACTITEWFSNSGCAEVAVAIQRASITKSAFTEPGNTEPGGDEESKVDIRLFYQ